MTLPFSSCMGASWSQSQLQAEASHGLTTHRGHISQKWHTHWISCDLGSKTKWKHLSINWRGRKMKSKASFKYKMRTEQTFCLDYLLTKQKNSFQWSLELCHDNPPKVLFIKMSDSSRWACIILAHAGISMSGDHWQTAEEGAGRTGFPIYQEK